jgi:hypothetical protein
MPDAASDRLGHQPAAGVIEQDAAGKRDDPATEAALAYGFLDVVQPLRGQGIEVFLSARGCEGDTDRAQFGKTVLGNFGTAAP